MSGMPTPIIRGLLMLAVVASAAAAGCGDASRGGQGASTSAGAPSESRPAAGGAFAGSLSARQLATFERANVKLVNVTNSSGPRNQVEFQLRRACGRLDKREPMLRAFARRCRSTLAFAHALGLRQERCADGGTTDGCGSAYRKIAGALRGLRAGTRAYKTAAKALTDDRACLDALLPSARSTAAMETTARSARRTAAALKRGDEAAYMSAAAEFNSTLTETLDDNGPAGPIINRIRGACGLVRTQSPPGERTT